VRRVGRLAVIDLRRLVGRSSNSFIRMTPILPAGSLTRTPGPKYERAMNRRFVGVRQFADLENMTLSELSDRTDLTREQLLRVLEDPNRAPLGHATVLAEALELDLEALAREATDA
jgi:hypothetical protein